MTFIHDFFAKCIYILLQILCLSDEIPGCNEFIKMTFLLYQFTILWVMANSTQIPTYELQSSWILNILYYFSHAILKHCRMKRVEW